MSDVVTGGATTAAVGACAALAGAAIVGAGYAFYKAASWLNNRMLHDMETLEKALQDAPTHASSRDARRYFDKAEIQARTRAQKNPVLAQHAESVARLTALGKSPLAYFVRQEEWQTLVKRQADRKSIVAVLYQAATRLKQANAAYVIRSIVEAAHAAGFAHQKVDDAAREGQRTLVLEDKEGRALVADVTESDDGAGVNLDLVGFGDGSCHAVMDRILAELEKRQVQTRGFARRSHYSREGARTSARIFSPVKRRGSKAPAPEPTPGDRRDLVRRQQKAATLINRLRQR